MKKIFVITYLLNAHFLHSMDMERDVSFNFENIQNFSFPQQNEGFEDYVGKQQEPYKSFEINSEQSLKEAVWRLYNPFLNGNKIYAFEILEKINQEYFLKEILFHTLRPNQRYVEYEKMAIECVKKIKNQEVLKEALFNALRPNTLGYSIGDLTAVEIIKSIKDPAILENALNQALEPSYVKGVRSPLAAKTIIKKTKNQKLLQDALLKCSFFQKDGCVIFDKGAAECIKKIKDEKFLDELFKKTNKNPGDYRYTNREFLKKFNNQEVSIDIFSKSLSINKKGKPYSPSTAYDCVKKINNEKFLEEALLIALDLDVRGFVLSEKIAIHCFEKIKNKEIVMKAVFKALEPDKKGKARSEQFVLQFLNYIEDEEILKQILLEALEPNNVSYARSHEIARACIQKINNLEILYTALEIALTPNTSKSKSPYVIQGDTRCSAAVIACIQKINDEKVLKETLFSCLKPDICGKARNDIAASECILKIQNKDIIINALDIALQEIESTIKAPGTVKTIFSLKDGGEPFVSNQELIEVYERTSNPGLRECVQYEVRENRPELRAQVGLEEIINISGEEALADNYKKNVDAFKKIKEDPKKIGLFPQTHEEAKVYFEKNFELLNHMLSQNEDNFIHQTAKLGLYLINGDSNVPRYNPLEIKAEDYATTFRNKYSEKITALQLFVFLTKICEKNKETSYDQKLWNFFLEQFQKENLWHIFQSQAQDAFQIQGITLRGNIPDTINNLHEGQNKFLETLKNNLNLSCLKGLSSYLHKEEKNLFYEAYTPSIEVLFMLQRGHNEIHELEDSTKQNKPRCPLGLWDDLLYQIGLNNDSVPEMMNNIEKCE